MILAKLQQYKYLSPIAIAALIFYFIFVNNRLYGEINGSFISYGFVWKQSFIPFWSSQLSGGLPLYAQPEIPLFGILNFMMAIVPNVILAFDFTVLVHMLIAGLGAGLLAFEFTKNKHSAIVSGISYMFIGNFAYSVFSSILPFIFPLAFLPLIFLFAYKAITANTVRNSLITAALLAYQLISGGTIYFLWSFLGIGVFLGTLYLFMLPKLKKFVLIGVIILIFTLSFSAVKLLPSYDFNQLSNRADSVSYDEFLWTFTQVTPSNILPSMFGTEVNPIRIGVVVTLLAAASLLTWRRKYFLALAAVAGVALLIELNTPLTKLIYQLPGYDKTRQIFNVLGLFALSMAMFAGIGWANILKKIKVKHSFATAGILALIVFELFVIGYNVERQPFEKNFQEQLDKNYLLQNVSNDTGLYRLHLYGDDFVGLSLTKYAVPLNIRMLDWTTSNIWFNDYIQFISIAGQEDSAKLWGIASTKYIASRQLLNISGLEFVGEFAECNICDLKAKYLYKNSLFIPEAYTAQQALLIVGQSSTTESILFQLLFGPTFNPETTAIITAETLPEQLNRFDMVILTEQPSGSDNSRLAEFVEQGKLLEPNIFEGSNSLNYDAISTFFSSTTGLLEAEIIEFSPTKIVVKPQQPGFLIISEKFYKFDEWQPKEKFKANAYSTAVYATDTITFTYTPTTFYKGLAITLAAIIIAILLLRFQKKKN